MTARQPMAFYHADGNVPAWNFAMQYAGNDGHIATLPGIIEARLATGTNELPWRTYFTTNTAEYYGVGADGTEKLIVAHGVGPMSTLEGIKEAYSWEYKDKSRNRQGGRISATDFLLLEAGGYGDVTVIDFRTYLDTWEDAFYTWHNSFTGHLDELLLARLGERASHYLVTHARHANKWHKHMSVRLPDGGRPFIIENEGASNCPYYTYESVNGRLDWSRRIPRPLESGMAMGHLLSISGLAHVHSGGWQGLVCEVSCHEWTNGTRFVGVPSGGTFDQGIQEFIGADEVLREQWERFLRPNLDDPYVPPRLYRLEETENGWFTRYSKPSDGYRMDDGDIEFHVRSVERIGALKEFKIDDDFFVRYNLSQVVALAPKGANGYDIVDVSTKDAAGLTAITVEFYKADVDTSHRLPRVKEINQDYELLMG